MLLTWSSKSKSRTRTPTDTSSALGKPLPSSYNTVYRAFSEGTFCTQTKYPKSPLPKTGITLNTIYIEFLSMSFCIVIMLFPYFKTFSSLVRARRALLTTSKNSNSHINSRKNGVGSLPIVLYMPSLS